ncbi:MAG: hypothetical protein QOF55_2099 [Thermoleophilaceae bacterium]|nr:hypothetical protein [Thermoleophilaceae bacterium]
MEAVAAVAPLCELSAAQREELARELAQAHSLEDLPGKWQAAVLAAELGPGAGSHSCGHC